MLLFSTTLDIEPTLSQDAFIRLVLEWNENSSYAENKVADIHWQGEHTVRYGSPGLWLEFVEYPEKKIIAVRHEKITSDGVAWDSDFIMDFDSQRMSIQLDRTYSEEALVMNAAFSTPHFISLLIQKGYLTDDDNLSVDRTPIRFTDTDFAIIEKIVIGNSRYKLPVIIVTKTEQDEDPVDSAWLASRVKGAAHVLIETSMDKCTQIRSQLFNTEEPYGAVRIYYPSESVQKKRYRYRSANGDRDNRLEKIIRNIIEYGIAQKRDHLYTWNGVSSAVLSERLNHQIANRKLAESAKENAEAEVERVYETFDEELQSLQQKVEELTKANEALLYENHGLRAKYAEMDTAPLLYFGDEEEFYQGEIRDLILSSLDDALAATEKATRKADVLEDILENNPYYHLSEERKQRIKTLLKGYKSLSSAMRQELLSLGFEITEIGKHYKITYHGDQRYMVTIPKTPSDSRSGNNSAATINKTMF